MKLLAIDPGNTESAYALVDATTRRPLAIDKLDNQQLVDHLASLDPGYIDHVAIEMVASYGMAVGADVFETCVWIGRFQQAVLFRALPGMPVDLVYRKDVKLHLCGTTKAKDANISQALVDRFAAGQPNRGKGTKAEPGWFHGFRADIWQAYALAVLAADRLPTDAIAGGTR